jgi:hypothetical protein
MPVMAESTGSRFGHCHPTARNGPSKTLSKSFRRSFGVSRVCNFSGSNSNIIDAMLELGISEIDEELQKVER